MFGKLFLNVVLFLENCFLYIVFVILFLVKKCLDNCCWGIVFGEFFWGNCFWRIVLGEIVLGKPCLDFFLMKIVFAKLFWKIVFG